MLTDILAGAQLFLFHFFICRFNCQCIEKKSRSNLTVFWFLVYVTFVKNVVLLCIVVLTGDFGCHRRLTVFPPEQTLSHSSFTFPVSFPFRLPFLFSSLSCHLYFHCLLPNYLCFASIPYVISDFHLFLSNFSSLHFFTLNLECRIFFSYKQTPVTFKLLTKEFT